MNAPMKVGITGATGNLGRRLLTFLDGLNPDHSLDIRCLVRSPERLPKTHRGVTHVVGDFSNPQTLTEFVRGLDVCIHLASLVGYGRPRDYYKTNVQGTKALCEAIFKINPRCRLVHCSSIAVLRRHPRWTWLNTDYANSKHQADEWVNDFRARGLKASIVYPGLIYGPEDTHLVPTLAHYLRGRKLIFLSGGEHHCPAVYIDDLCALFTQVALNPDTPQQDYIGVGPQEDGIHGFIAKLARRINAPVPRLKLPKSCLIPVALIGELWYLTRRKAQFPTVSKRSVDLLSINLSPNLVQRYNGELWHANTPMDQGLDLAVQWCRDQKLI